MADASRTLETLFLGFTARFPAAVRDEIGRKALLDAFELPPEFFFDLLPPSKNDTVVLNPDDECFLSAEPRLFSDARRDHNAPIGCDMSRSCHHLRFRHI